MIDHRHFGIIAKEKGWVPAPRYLLRRARILDLLSPLKRGKVLEIGCGAGALLHDLNKMFFETYAVETSQEALKIATYINPKNNFIYQQIQTEWFENFDFLLSFEVLEHVENDLDLLKSWYDLLKSGGYLLISVPAYMKKWTATDEWAGHYRRYEEEDIKAKIENAGFKIQKFECYGFPLANLIEPLRAYYHDRKLKKKLDIALSPSKKKATDRSGVERSLENKLFPLMSNIIGTQIINFFCNFQKKFLKKKLGNGFIILCTKQ